MCNSQDFLYLEFAFIKLLQELAFNHPHIDQILDMKFPLKWEMGGESYFGLIVGVAMGLK